MYTQLSLFLVPIFSLFYRGSTTSFDNIASGTPQYSNEDVTQVAIIGAGAAGTSTAYHPHKFATESGVTVNITVFLKDRLELGASIFVEVNRILKNVSDEFGLRQRSRKSASGEPELIGIWNGEKFVFTLKGDASWLDLVKLFWKYGLAPLRTERLMRRTAEKFSLSGRVLDLDLASITAVTGQEFLAANNIGPPFTTDIIQASTRVNYAQNLGIIHGLETMVCMNTDGAIQIEEGNWQIFHHMLKTASASVFLNTTVNGLGKQDGKYTLQFSSSHDSQSTSATAEMRFDTVVLAAPLQFSGIKLQKSLVNHMPDNIPYVTLYVTLFTSPLKRIGAHFKLKEGAEVPTTVFTKLAPDEDPSNGHNMVGKSGFFSISTLRAITNPRTLRKEYIYKIFSPEKVTEELLLSLFGIQPISGVSIFNTSTSDAISWYHPHVWQSYPYEYPRVTFEDPELARGFYYTSGIENFISTMETSALMGMNVAQLIVHDYLEIMGKLKVQDPRGSTTGKVRLEEVQAPLD